MNKNSDYNAGVNVKEMIDNLPAGLDRAMLRILEFHKGRENAISRGRLLADLGLMGFVVHEREARVCINQLRKEGVEICSTGGSKGGYWMAVSQDEVMEFTENELEPRAMDLLEQSKAMKAAAERRWGKYSRERQESFQL